MPSEAENDWLAATLKRLTDLWHQRLDKLISWDEAASLIRESWLKAHFGTSASIDIGVLKGGLIKESPRTSGPPVQSDPSPQNDFYTIPESAPTQGSPAEAYRILLMMYADRRIPRRLSTGVKRSLQSLAEEASKSGRVIVSRDAVARALGHKK
jgi:hypothetical protein